MKDERGIPTLEAFRTELETMINDLMRHLHEHNEEFHIEESLPPTLMAVDAEGQRYICPLLLEVTTLPRVRVVARLVAAQLGAVLVGCVLDGDYILAPEGSMNRSFLDAGGDPERLPQDDKERKLIAYLEDSSGGMQVSAYGSTSEGGLDSAHREVPPPEFELGYWPLLAHNQFRQGNSARQN